MSALTAGFLVACLAGIGGLLLMVRDKARRVAHLEATAQHTDAVATRLEGLVARLEAMQATCSKGKE